MPTTLDGYRMVYRAHIHDPDIQDARAYFPFVCIGDNHEFSWQGWQSFIKYRRPARAGAGAARRGQPGVVGIHPRRGSARRPAPGLDAFDGPTVENVADHPLDADGLGDEPNNRAALASMTAYRAMRYGRHVELILTDFHSYTMEIPPSRDEADAFTCKDFPNLFPAGGAGDPRRRAHL